MGDAGEVGSVRLGGEEGDLPVDLIGIGTNDLAAGEFCEEESGGAFSTGGGAGEVKGKGRAGHEEGEAWG
jgi:hypothetical protein